LKRLFIGLIALTLTACSGLLRDSDAPETTEAGLVKTAGVGGLIIRVTTEEERPSAAGAKAGAPTGAMITLMYNGLKNNKAVLVRTVFDLVPPPPAREESFLPDSIKPVYVERAKKIIEVDTKQLPARLTIEGISIQVISANRQFMTYVIKY
jgi:hypothetical protein